MSSGHDFMRHPAIDVHGHFGVYEGYTPQMAALFNAPAQEASRRAADAAIALTVCSELGAFDPAEGRKADVDAANARAVAAVEKLDNLRFWAVANPRDAGWQKRTEKLLEHPRCCGVKLHPLWHYYDVTEYGERLFEFLHRNRALTMTHSGDLGNEPRQFVPFANKFPEAKLILAHIGNDGVTDRRDAQVAAVEQSTQGNVWADTSSATSMLARVIENAVERIGAERVLFGTDTPLYFAAAQKARIAYANISDDDKRKVLYDNAAALLGLVQPA